MISDIGYRIWDKTNQKYITRSAIYYTYDGYGDNSKSMWKQIPAVTRVINKAKDPSRYEIHRMNIIFERVV